MDKNKIVSLVLLVLASICAINLLYNVALDHRFSSELQTLRTTDDFNTTMRIEADIEGAVAKNITSWQDLGITDSEFNTMIATAQNRGRAKYDLEDLKTTEYYVVAQSDASEIRHFVASNLTSWEKLGTNDSEIDRLVFAAQGRGAKTDLENLRFKDVESWNVQGDTDGIREAIAANATSWTELGITSSQFNKVVLEAKKREAVYDLKELNTTSSSDTIAYLEEEIRELVAENATSWQELRINSTGLDKMIIGAKKREAKRYLDYIPETTSVKETKIYETRVLRMITDNVTDWKTLGTTSSDFDRLVTETEKQNSIKDLAALNNTTSAADAEYYAESIRIAIADNSTTWQDLGINNSTLNQKVTKL